MSVETDIIRLKAMGKAAVARKDWNVARRVKAALEKAKAEFSPQPQPEQEALPPVDSSLHSFGLGVQRGTGRKVAGAKEIGSYFSLDPLGEEAGQSREEIMLSERGKEEAFKQQTANNPIAAFSGQMVPELPFIAGRTPTGAFLRGATSGGLTYNEDPTARGAQTLLGGGANVVGRKLPGLLNKDVLRTQQQGLRMMPEQRVSSPLDNFVSSLRVSKAQGRKVATFNQKAITQEALGRLGVKGDRFADDTLGIVSDRTGEMFEKAVSGKRNIFLGGVARTKIQSMLEPELKVLRPKGEGKTLLTDFLEDIETGGGIMSIKNYQDVRSKFTKMIIKTTDADRKLAMGQVIETLDDSATRSLKNQPEKLKLLREARKQWRDFVLISNPGIVNDAGRINTGKLRTLLNRKDRGGFMLNRDTGKLNEMLRLDKRGPQVGTPADPFTITNLLTNLPERAVIGANRLPTRAVEGTPLGLTVPLLKNTIPSDETELKIRR